MWVLRNLRVLLVVVGVTLLAGCASQEADPVAPATATGDDARLYVGDEEGRITSDTLKCAVIYGSAMASFVVERFGPERLLPLTEEVIDTRLQAFRDLSAIPTIIPLVGISS